MGWKDIMCDAGGRTHLFHCGNEGLRQGLNAAFHRFHASPTGETVYREIIFLRICVLILQRYRICEFAF